MPGSGVKHAYRKDTLKHVYEKEYSEWVLAGKPTGFFWTPKNENIPISSEMGFAKGRITWIKKIPIWLKNDKYALALIWANRISAVLSAILVVILITYSYSN